MVTGMNGTFTELMQWILSDFGLDYRGLDKIGMQQALVEFLKRQEVQGKRVMLVIDEAQALEAEVLEELRLFSNVNAGRTTLLQTVLVGQLALRDSLRRSAMRQFAQRVAVDYLLIAARQRADPSLHPPPTGVSPARAKEDLFTADACDVDLHGERRHPTCRQSALRYRTRLRLRRPEAGDRRDHR